MKAWVLRFAPALVIMAVIFLASATPGSELPAFGIWDLAAKKGGHMLGYALLAAAYYHALSRGRNTARAPLLIAFCLTVLYAATDEWHQSFVPGRSPSFQDICIDAIGGLIGSALLHRHRMRRAKPSGGVC